MRVLARLTALVLLVAAAFLPAALASPVSGAADVPVRVLSMASWLGQLDPLTAANGRTVGGAPALAAYWQKERDPHTLTLATGNSFGTSPPISTLFDDVPAMYALNMMGVQADSLGNDNFDHGLAYLQRLIDLAEFDYLAANLEHLPANLRGTRPYTILDAGGVKVAVIGVTDPASPGRVFPGYFGSISVSEPAAAANAARQAAAAAGARVFILSTEMGILPPGQGALRGPLVTLAGQLQGFDLVLGASDQGDHSTTINGALVVANQRRGLSYVRTSLNYSPDSGRVTAKSAAFVTPWTSEVTPDARITAMIDSYRTQLSGRLSEVAGTSRAEIAFADACGQPDGRFCESLAGNLVADALRTNYRTEFAIINAGAIRANATCPRTDIATDFCPPFSTASYPITRGQIQAVLPFSNGGAVAQISGDEFKAYLENGVSLLPANAGRFPQVSGFCFSYDIGRPAGSRVTAAVRQAADGSCTGAALDLSAGANYTIAVNNFMAAGGDGYPVLREPVSNRAPLVNVVGDYVAGHPDLSPVLQGRIVCTSSGGTPCLPILSGPTGQVLAGAPAGASTGTIRPPSTGDAGLR